MKKTSRRSTFHVVLGALTSVGLVVAAYRFLDLQALLKAWQRFSWEALLWIVLLPAIYLLAKAIRFRTLVRPISNVSGKAVVIGYCASQSASLLPGGVAMRAAMMHRLGIPVEKSAGPILANSASDQLLLLGAGLGLCYYYRELRFSAIVLTAILLVLVAVLKLRPIRDWICKKCTNIAARFGQESRMERLVDALPFLADLALFRNAMLWTVVANGCSILALCVIVGSFGFPVEPWPLAAAFVIPNLLGRLSPLPAGAGVVEAGMIGFMASQTSMSFDQAAAATIVFRVVDILLPAFYGGLCHLFLMPSDPEESVSREAFA